jgi:excisionase family DNA binding protein
MSVAEEDERLTVGETAKELGVSEKTVRRLIHRGALPAYRISERTTYVLRADLQVFLQSSRTAKAKQEAH